MSAGSGAAARVLAAVPSDAGAVAASTGDAGDSPPRRRHSAELYDAIWSLDLPRVPKVTPAAVRLVLLAIAKYTNPTRDGGQFRCCPSVETIAMLAEVCERQVQRVLARFIELGYIEVETTGVRAGRGRPARPGWWRLRPDRWPQRTPNGGVPQVVTMTNTTPMVATHGTRPCSDGGDPQATKRPMVASPGSPKPVRVKPVTPQQQPAREELKNDNGTRALPLPLMLTEVPPPSVDTRVLELVAAHCRGLDSDIASLTQPLLRRELAIARDLVAAGATPDEAEAFARDVGADAGRKAPIDGLRTFERERLGWLARRRGRQLAERRVVDRTGQPPSWQVQPVERRLPLIGDAPAQQPERAAAAAVRGAPGVSGNQLADKLRTLFGGAGQ
jgi:hypothetical protein